MAEGGRGLMSSVFKKPNGRYAIQFVINGRKRTITVGRMDKRDVTVIARHIDYIIASRTGAKIPAATLSWLDTPEGVYYRAELVKRGVIDEDTAAITVGDWLDRFIESRTDVKPGTVEIYRQIERNMTEHFGSDRTLATITPADADAFKAWLISDQKLARNTVNRRIGLARQVFIAAMRARIVDFNPFGHISAKVKGRPDRFHHVTMADYAKLMATAPDHDWKCIIALSRIGAVRVPSEIMPLTWGDVNWEDGRITITSPKTDHIGKGVRILPLFPELEQVLREAFDAAPEGSKHIITRYRSGRQNLRTTFTKIVKRAGLVPWPKLFTNMRASRSIELVATFPKHVCDAWIGNTEAVREEHYLSVIDSHYDEARAAKSLANGSANSATHNAERTERNGVIVDSDSESQNAASMAVGGDSKSGPQGFEP